MLYYFQIMKLNNKKCYKILSIVHKIFKENDLFFCFSEGTALGFIREGDFIKWDDDVDIGMWIDDMPKFIKCIPIFESYGFEVAEVTMNNTFICLIKDNIKLDIDFTGPNINCRAHNFKLFGETCNTLLPYLKKFKKIKIKDLEYNIPEVCYLEKLYGKGWKIPLKGYKPK